MVDNPYQAPDTTNTGPSNSKLPFFVRQNAMTWFAGSFALALALVLVGPFLVLVITGDRFPLGATLFFMLAGFVIFFTGSFLSIFISNAKKSYHRKNKRNEDELP